MSALLTLTLLANLLSVPLAPRFATAETQNAYRWRNDDGTEANATWAAAENTGITLDKGVTKRLRMGLENDGDDSELVREATGNGHNGEGSYMFQILDEANGFGYFVTATNPSKVVKVNLSTFARVGVITLEEGEDFMKTGAIDETNGYLYLTHNYSSAKVVKINLSTFTRVGSLTLDESDGGVTTAGIDETNGFLYLGTSSSPGEIVKVNLSTFARVGKLTLESGENSLHSTLIDEANGFGYFGTNTSPGIAVKVNLSTFSRVGALTMNSGENELMSVVFDPGQELAFFGTDSSTAMVVKVDLSTFTRIGAITMSAGEGWLRAAGIDTANGYAYFAGATTPTPIVKIDVGSGAFSRVSGMTLDSDDSFAAAGEIVYTTGGDIFVSTFTNPGRILQVDMATMTRTDAIVDSQSGENRYSTLAIDDNGYGYFGTYMSPATITKFDLSDMSRVDALQIDAGTSSLTAGVVSATVDTVNGYAYFGLLTSPGKIVKVNLSTFTVADTLVLPAGVNSVTTAFIDSANQFAYFGIDVSPAKVVKLNLSTFTVTDTLTLDTGENRIRSGNIDATSSYAYFNTWTNPAKVVKVNLSTFTKDSTITFNSGESYAYGRSDIDDTNGFLYVGLYTFPGKVVKVNLSTFARSDVLTLSSGDNGIGGVLVDETNDRLQVIAYNWGDISKIIEVDRSSFTQVQSLSLEQFEGGIDYAVLDEDNGHIYFGLSGTYPGRAIKVSVVPRPDVRLEYGLKSTSCSAISDWNAVGDGVWGMSDSSYLTHGAATTNVASGVSDGNTTFTAGYVLDTSATASAGIQLDNVDFTEVEWSVRAGQAATDGATYCFRVSDAGSVSNHTFTNYAEATLQATYSATVNNAATMSRLAAGEASTFDLSFTLSSAQSTDLTVTFPSGFTVTGAFTGGTCSGGGDIGTFAYTATTLTAEKSNCSGLVALTGAAVTNPSTPGTYTISWVNDDPGSTTVVIPGDDQVNVLSSVDPSVTFDIDTGVATSVDSTAAYTVAFGAVSTADVETSGATDGVNHIGIDLAANASGGAVVTIQNANGTSGLVSTSGSPDNIANAAGTMAAGTENYGFCVSYTSATIGTLQITGSSNYDGLTCASDSATNGVAALTTTPHQFLDSNGAAISGGRAVLVGNAAISPTTDAHDDYTDTLTFIATGTF